MSVMFEDSAHFDFDDDAVLGTSFTPASSSTQTSHASQVLKRNNTEIVQDDSKKPKLSNNEQKVPEYSSPQGNKSRDSTFCSSKKLVKRKFPGPAGLLPERIGRNRSISELIADEDLAVISDSRDEILFCSQRTNSAFEDGPWKEMTKDFCICNGEYLYEKFNINWIKKQASLKKLLVNHKAPFLAAIIQSLEIFDGKVPTVNVTLKDSTGDIQGTILYSLYEEYSNFFTLGSVLVLKQFGVLSAGYNNHCLTITPNNLLTIYCLEVPKKPPESAGEEGCAIRSGSVKKIVIQQCVLEEILKKYNEDVLANSEQRQKSIDFGKLNQNYGRLSRNNSDFGNCSTNKFMSSALKNQETQRNTLNIPQFQNVLKRWTSENSKAIVSDVPIKSFNTVTNRDIDIKKKFNFKESLKLPVSSTTTMSFDGQSECTTNQTTNRNENNNSDNILVSSSQISIKPDSKEHTDIWKNLLQDVDTESLFDDF